MKRILFFAPSFRLKALRSLTIGCITLCIASKAHAGEWEVVALPEPETWMYFDENAIEEWEAEAALRYAGTTTSQGSEPQSNSSYPSGDYPSPPVSSPIYSRSFAWMEMSDRFGQGVWWGKGDGQVGVGGAAYGQVSGTARSLLRWRRNTITNAQNQQVPDPNDDPPPFAFVQMEVESGAVAITTDVSPSGEPVRYAGKEHVVAWVEVPQNAIPLDLFSATPTAPDAPIRNTGQETDEGYGKIARASRKILEGVRDSDAKNTPRFAFWGAKWV